MSVFIKYGRSYHFFWLLYGPFLSKTSDTLGLPAENSSPMQTWIEVLSKYESTFLGFLQGYVRAYNYFGTRSVDFFESRVAAMVHATSIFASILILTISIPSGL